MELIVLVHLVFCHPQVREEIEFENLAKMYLREMIKKECWDDMVVKGRAVQVILLIIKNSKCFRNIFFSVNETQCWRVDSKISFHDDKAGVN